MIGADCGDVACVKTCLTVSNALQQTQIGTGGGGYNGGGTGYNGGGGYGGGNSGYNNGGGGYYGPPGGFRG